MNRRQLFDLAIQAMIEQAHGEQEAQAGQTPSFVSQALLDATIEDASIGGSVTRSIAPHHLLKGTVFVAAGQECFLVRLPNPHQYPWFAHRFYVVTHDALRGYRCSCPNAAVRPYVIAQVERFVAAEAAAAAAEEGAGHDSDE